MTYNLPLRRTTLHLAQRFRMDGETFMNSNLLTTSCAVLYGQSFDYTLFCFIRPARNESASVLKDSQDERIAFGDSYTMFKMSCQRTVCRDNSPLIR